MYNNYFLYNGNKKSEERMSKSIFKHLLEKIVQFTFMWPFENLDSKIIYVPLHYLRIKLLDCLRYIKT